MRWAVYVDLSRPLAAEEQRLVFASLDEIVPDSGCVGPNRTGDHEIYFSVETGSLEEAQVDATRYVDAVLGRAGVSVSYVIDAQPLPAKT